MPSVYCCYENDNYLGCYNTMDEANANLNRAIEKEAKKNILLANGMPDTVCQCQFSSKFDELLRMLNVPYETVNDEIERIRSNFSVVEKNIV